MPNDAQVLNLSLPAVRRPGLCGDTASGAEVRDLCRGASRCAFARL